MEAKKVKSISKPSIYCLLSHTSERIPKATVCFSPEQDCAVPIISEIDQSKESILVQEYTFTLGTVAKSLINAKERGVDVKVVLDKSQLHSKYSVISELFSNGIPIWIDNKPKIAHNKVIIVDNQKESRPAELPHQSLAELHGNLSTYTAPII